MRIGDVRKAWRSIGTKYQALPTPNEPEKMVDIPQNPDDLVDSELDRCLLSFGAWRGYVSSRLAEVSAQLSLLESAYSIRLGNIMADMERKAKKKMLKESLIGEAVSSDEELTELQKEVTEMKAEKLLLEGKFSFYDGQFETISRVITRRGQEKQRGY